MESKKMNELNLQTTLRLLFRKEISIESMREDLYHGILVYVGNPEDIRKKYITIDDILLGKCRVKFLEIHRLWKNNKL